MKLKLTKFDSWSETEGDYDTAVDLVYYHSSTEVYNLETLHGVNLTITKNEITSSKSYLEVDYDHFEKTGETQYNQYKSNEENTTKTYYHVEYSLINTLPKLDYKDFFLLEETTNSNEQTFSWKEKQIALYNEAAPEERYHISLYLDFTLGDNREFNASSFENLEPLFEQLAPIYLKKGHTFDIELPVELEKLLNQLNQTSEERIKTNFATRIHNQCEQASFNIDKKIDKLVKEYQLKFMPNSPDLNNIGVSPKF